ncbi:hypothetical protein Q5762_24950 [Streptomyces sp. P9(2023)]|uniref:hypothetical protein n=1 Tax=Streptomyces sp. P9(2023) TaxID=3064394 RepID=UPI0028F422CA|nr:hypothetical protein [Streptomyces sp. P9(2023)]MDT9691530.1 hypothetical protein [Streptomyces sp. P9(2023)]
MTSCQGEGCRRGRAEGRARRRTSEGSRLCRGCADRFEAEIEQIPRLYEECERVLGGGVADGLRERTSGGTLPGLPFNEAASEVRVRMLATLGSWSGLVAQERGLPAPERTVAATGAFLLRHASWLASHPAVADATEEIAKLVRDGRRVTRSDGSRTVRVGPCAEPDCPGTLSLTLHDRPRHAEHAEHAEPRIRCDADEAHSWAGHRWSELNRSMEAGAATRAAEPATERWLTAADISVLQQVPVGTVYRLASEQRWRRRRGAGRTYYSENDVELCFGSRPARR